jgi:hypothetical protein
MLEPSSGSSYQHPALASAADDQAVVKLEAASDLVVTDDGAGVPGPLQALPQMDCAPSLISGLADYVKEAQDIFADSTKTFRDADELAKRDWKGPAREEYHRKYVTVSVARRTEADLLAKTEAAGRESAAHLDTLAKQTADQTVAIARRAEHASDALLSGDLDAEAMEIVADACHQVLVVVNDHVNRIPEAFGAFEGLTEPAVPA